jgi:hypothetical protein
MVGSPVDGPARCTLTTTQGVSVHTQDGGHGGDFILHLDKGAADSGKPRRHPLGDFRCRGDGIGPEKKTAGGQRPFGAGFVAGHEMFAGQHSIFHVNNNLISFMKTKTRQAPQRKRWQIPGKGFRKNDS